LSAISYLYNHGFISIVFNSLNFERTQLVLEKLIWHISVNGGREVSHEQLLAELRPDAIAKKEKIFRNSFFQETNFRTWSTSRSCVNDICRSIEIFGSDANFFVCFCRKLSFASRLVKKLPRALTKNLKLDSFSLLQPEVFLRKNGTQFDVLKSAIVVYKAIQLFETLNEDTTIVQLNDDLLFQVLESSRLFQVQNMDNIVKILDESGWDVYKYMFGTIVRRVDW